MKNKKLFFSFLFAIFMCLFLISGVGADNGGAGPLPDSGGDPVSVPEPSTLLMLGTGLVALIYSKNSFKKNS